MRFAKAGLFACVAAAIGVAAARADSVTSPVMRSGGENAGSVTLTDAPQGVLVRIAVTGLAPGWHAIHFHATGDCSDSKFENSGAHVNHADHKMPHGLLNPAGPDFGDLPNIHAAADGRADAEVFTTLVALHGGASQPNLLDSDGSALVIHAAADDHSSQPIGGAGSRVACAAFKAR